MEFKPGLTEAVERLRRLFALQEPLDRVPAFVSIPLPSRDCALDGSFFGRLRDYLAFMKACFGAQAAVLDDAVPMLVPQYGSCSRSRSVDSAAACTPDLVV